MRLNAFDTETALSQVAVEYRIDQSPAALRAAIICEYIRAAVYMGNQEADGAPISKLRVVRLVLERAAPFFKPSAHDGEFEVEIKTEVRHLIATRDLVDTSAGLQLAPIRLVELSLVECLLIGGGPIQTLPIELRASVRHVARARIVTVDAANSILNQIPRQSPKDWLTITIADSTAWSDTLREDAKKKMVAAYELGDVDILLNGSWRSIRKVRDPEEPVLIRFKPMPFAKYSHALARTTIDPNGDLQIVKLHEVSYNDARRLRGAWPISGKKPVLDYQTCADIIEFNARSSFAMPEANLLSLGTFEASKPPFKWPRRYFIAQSLLPILLLALGSLGYEINDTTK